MAAFLTKTTDKLLIARLLREQGAQHWRAYGLAFSFMLMIGGATALSAYLMKDVINEVFISRNESAIWFLAGAVMVIYTVKGLGTYGQQVTLSRVANRIVATIQREMYEHMLAMDVRFYADRHSSDFIARQSFIAGSAGTALNLIVISLGRDLITLIGLIAVMVIQDPLMSVVGLIILPIAVTSLRSLVKRARKVMHTEFSGGLVIMATVQETAVGIKTIKSFTMEDNFRQRMFAAIGSLERAANKLAAVGSRSVPIMETLGGFAVAGVILYGGYRVVLGGQSPGAFFSFITALLMAYEPAKRLARVHVDLGAALVGVQMLFEFLDLNPQEADDADKPKLIVREGLVEFRRVCFSYRDGEAVLNDFDLMAQAGKVTALVGHSGGGKSTVVSLIQRLYEVSSGQIFIDGQDISLVSRRSLRAQVAVVSQEPFLFKGTIFENIAVGRPGADEAEVIKAAKAAHAHNFISGFQSGYQTQVGEQGHQLSGGQRQRLAIARALLKDAPVLLLDEATAALDSETEREVQLALDALAANRTTIVVAHRLQTIQWADKICVIEGGRVTEEGEHAALLSRKGRYAQVHAIYASQDRRGAIAAAG